jgi:hypothetical protein
MPLLVSNPIGFLSISRMRVNSADVLETSSIAWPNPSMWRQASFVGPYFAHQYSPRQGSEGIEAHSHSPRQDLKPSKAQTPIQIPPNFGAMFRPNVPRFTRQSNFDPFVEPSNSSFIEWRQPSSNHTDVSMPDASVTQTHSNSSRQVSDPMQGTEKSERRFESMQTEGAYDTLCEALIPSVPSAPVNTPENAATPRTTSVTLASSMQRFSANIKAENVTGIWNFSSRRYSS